MRYKQLGRTGLMVSELCLGTMTFGGKGFWTVVGQQGQELVDQIVQRSLAAGVNFIDTADVYSEGESEKLLGRALKNLGVARSDVVIATKAFGRTGAGPNDLGASRGHLMDAIAKSLDRLQLDYVDLYQIHGWDTVTPIEETLRALDDIVRSGRVRYIGVSNWAAWQMMKANGLAERHDWMRFETVQAYYSIAGRDLEREIVPLVNDQKMGVLVWSPLAGGFLSGKTDADGKLPDGTRRATFDFPPLDRPRAMAAIAAMREVGARHGVSVARVALAWVLAKPWVTSIIFGAKTLEQLDDNLAATTLTLTSEDLAALDAVSALPPEYPGWMLAFQGANRLPAPKV
ncbi:MAG: aldo/keto reductase [Deltaproteobacteria bacterium]|jgi:aryl-alcohol dehydrogenase-like predicted oxidoreductase|nr:aldo/keto reductase [Deltaproteobacteria bacterium]